MFQVGDYIVTFMRLWRDKKCGRYDTSCAITYIGYGDSHLGVAYLHPNDKPDKIIGKKVALGKALESGGADKELRRMIWKAFWQWVSGWPNSGKST